MSDQVKAVADGLARLVRALYPLAPYGLIADALWSASHGAPETAWGGLLIAGAALIDPNAHKNAP